jgi:hypothetical protein
MRILDKHGLSRWKSSYFSVARFELNGAIKPYGEESIGWCVKARFAHPGRDVNKANA